MNVEEIKALFPSPVRKKPGVDPEPGTYCVGGAFIFATNPMAEGRYAFPGPVVMEKALRCENPKLSPMKAWSLGQHILKANDVGEFDRAWDLLEEALTYGV